MSDTHPVFHVSQLRKCLRVPEQEIVPMETIDLQKDLRYQEVPVKILDTVTKRTRSSEVRNSESNGADTEYKKLRGNAKMR